MINAQQPPEVRDLKSWLKMYGEPSPDKIPTGFLTTFRASKKVVVVVMMMMMITMKISMWRWHILL
jgi:hypothetical protein